MRIQSSGSTVTHETVIDMAWLKSATLADFMAVLQMAKIDPSKLAIVNSLLATEEGKQIANDILNDPDYVPVSQRTVTPEEQAQIDADTALAEQQAAEAAASFDAAPAAVVPQPLVPEPVAPVAPPAPVVPAAPVRKSLDYQVDDDNGQPLGRPTHIEYSSEEELIDKMRKAHTNAVRYAERMKKAQQNKRAADRIAVETYNASQQVVQAQAEADAATQIVVTDKDPVKVADAVKKITAAERNNQIALETARENGRIIAKMWMDDHKHDFLQCQANSGIIEEWLKTNNRAFTYDNLEEAFAANEGKFAKPSQAPEPTPVSVAPVVNPPVPTPVAPVAPVAPIAQPAPVAPAPVSVTPPAQPVATTSETPSAVAPNVQHTAQRPRVTAGLQPGSLSAQRPTVSQPSTAATREELQKVIDKMTGPEFRHKLKTSKQFRDQLEAAGIPVAGKAQYGDPRRG